MDKKYEIEIKEAITACDKSLHWLNKALKQLNRAQGWGIVDLLGGKSFVTFLKRRQITKAEKYMIKSEKAIKKMKKELYDVEAITDINFDMGVILTLADYFFGGAIADWIVLGRIGEYKKEIRKAKKQILSIRVDLEELLK